MKYFGTEMGNQRQLLKDNIERELTSKLEEAKDVLSQLNKSLEFSKQNAFSTKEEIRVSTDLIKEALIKRKKELLREVEDLHQAQIRPLHDSIKSTYITMGKLQSMLTNLDSFDPSQLTSLQIPAVDTSCTLHEPTQISAILECDNIREEVKEWGSITDEFHCFMLEDIPENLRRECNRKPSSAISCSSDARVPEAPLVENKENSKQAKEMEPRPHQLPPWSSWGIENWLSRSNKKLAENKDNFTPQSADEEMDFIVLQENDASSTPLNGSARDDGSSIMCLEKETIPSVDCNDLSMWLKPKKSKVVEQLPLEAKDKAALQTLVQTANVLQALSLSQTNRDNRKLNSGSKRLDFPCLHMSADTWIRKRKPKSASSVCSEKSMNSKHNIDKLKLIPPSYALPTAFWLKKYQKR